MIPKFPDLNSLQVVLIRADINTGHVLDEDFNLAVKEGQKVYTIFEDIGSAIHFAKSIAEENKNIECNLYGKEMKFLKRISRLES